MCIRDSILEAIVNMASMLHLPIVVEGVEDESQEKFVQGLGSVSYTHLG